MKKYILIEKGWTEKTEKFMERVNNKQGYEVVNFVHNGGGYVVMMKKIG